MIGCSPPGFRLGRLIATPEALDELRRLQVDPLDLVRRHQMGDWGDLDESDIQANLDALHSGARLLSAYTIQGVTFWVITEAENDCSIRQATTLLLPADY